MNGVQEVVGSNPAGPTSADVTLEPLFFLSISNAPPEALAYGFAEGIAAIVQEFFDDHLERHRNASAIAISNCLDLFFDGQIDVSGDLRLGSFACHTLRWHTLRKVFALSRIMF